MGNDHISRIYSLLGENAILIPVPSGAKAPIQRGWESSTLEVSKTPNWQSRLRKGNIGVLLGETGGNLVTIDCDTDEFAEDLIVLNPQFSRTLRTRGQRGSNFWFRCIGEYPLRTKKLSDRRKPKPNEVGEWRSGGAQTIIHGTHPSGCRYTVVQETTVLSIRFTEIVWPNWLSAPSTNATQQHSHSATQKPSNSASQSLSLTETHVIEDSFVCFDVSPFLPTAEHQNNGLLFQMARKVLDVERERGAPLDSSEVLAILDQWHSRNQHLRAGVSREEYLAEFLRGLTNAKIPLSETPLSLAASLIESEPFPPEASRYSDVKVKRLVSLCWQLQRLTAPGPFFLTCRDAGKIVGIEYTTAYRWLIAFCEPRTGFLQLKKRGSQLTREGNEYAFR